MARVIALVLLLAPALARADFTYDAGAIPNTPKTDNVTTTVAPNKKIAAVDFNAVVDALGSLRTGLLGGYYHGLSLDSAPPPALANTLVLFTLADAGTGPGTGVWVRNPDGSVARLAQQSELPAVAFWSATDANNITTPKVTTVPGLDAGNVNAATLTVTGTSTLAGVVTTAAVDAGNVNAGNVATATAQIGSLDAGAVKTTLLIANSIDAGNVYAGAYGFQDDSTVQATGADDVVCGFISSTASPQSAALYPFRHAGTIRKCQWTGTYGTGATGTVTFAVLNWDGGGTLCVKTQRCDGKFDDAGSSGLAFAGWTDCETSVSNGTSVLLGSQDTCSARPSVNYCCQISYP